MPLPLRLRAKAVCGPRRSEPMRSSLDLNQVALRDRCSLGDAGEEMAFPHLAQPLEQWGVAVDAELAEGARLVEIEADVVGGPTERLAAAVLSMEPARFWPRPRSTCASTASSNMKLAVLALADLQEGAVVGDPDVVALGIDEEDVGLLVADVAPK